MLLISCEVNLTLTWSARFFIIDASTAGQEPTYTITVIQNAMLQL